MTPLIYADENSKDVEGRYVLNIAGSRIDIEKYSQILKDGMKVIFDVQHEFKVNGILLFDKHSKVWYGLPDYRTIKYKK